MIILEGREETIKRFQKEDKNMKKMLAEIRGYYVENNAAEYGMSDSKFEKLFNRMLEKYDISEVDLFVEIKRIEAEIFGFNFDEKEEAMIRKFYC